MHCEEFQRAIDAYISGLLSDEAQDDFESHARGCPDCSAALDHARSFLHETGQILESMVPEGAVQDRLMSSVAGATMKYEKSWGEVMRDQWDHAPWWMISAAVHAVILMLMTIITVATAERKSDDVVITTDLAKKKEPEYDENKVRDIFRNTKEVEADEIVENPVFVHEEVEVTDHFETENDMETNTARGQEDAISDIPLGGTGVVGNIGVGGGGAGCFGYRTGGGRKRAVGKFGGSRASESSVDAALRWLARHQEPDGSWDCDKYPPQNRALHRGAQFYDPGVTGLALLAFLGAGHTERAGTFKKNVRNAVEWFIKNQKDDGSFTERGEGHYFYCDAIATLALAEAYGMARNPKVGEVAQKGIDFIKKRQTPYSGWRYSPKAPADTSVVGWVVMAAKSAKISGLKVDGEIFAGSQAFIDKMTEGDGTQSGEVKVVYMEGERKSSGFERTEHCTTAIGMLGRQFMGMKRNDPLLIGSAQFVRTKLPKWNEAHFYYWYYGTLAMFQMGGEFWKEWNNALRDMLVKNQRRGGDEDGSWDPKSFYGQYGGRVYSTALGALCLEVYYRYLPVYK